MFQSPGEVAFYIFGYPVFFYGIILAFSILVGVYCSYKLYKNFYSYNQASLIIDFSPIIIAIGIVGARLYYCLVNFSYYAEHPFEIFYVRQGGLSIHGMIIIGILALYFIARKYKMSFFKLMDVFLCSTALAQSIGRWGNFFNSEAFGLPTDLPWKLFIPISHRPIDYINVEYFHPTFLYESILDLVIFLILVFLFPKLSKKPGMVACLYLILYSVVRIFIEQIRVDSVLDIAGVHIAQLVSICIIIFALFFMFILHLKNKS